MLIIQICLITIALVLILISRFLYVIADNIGIGIISLINELKKLKR